MNPKVRDSFAEGEKLLLHVGEPGMPCGKPLVGDEKQPERRSDTT